jgi:hypothetical protein
MRYYPQTLISMSHQLNITAPSTSDIDVYGCLDTRTQLFIMLSRSSMSIRVAHLGATYLTFPAIHFQPIGIRIDWRRME